MKSALLALLITLTLTSFRASGQTLRPRLSDGNLTRASALILGLENFDNSLRHLETVDKSPAASLINAVHKKLSSFPESSIKTDIATAAYFYGLAAKTSHTRLAAPGTSSCATERPGMYRKLCEDNADSQRDLFLAKARLHVGWARAVLHSDDHNAIVLATIEAQRRDDQILATRAIAALRRLENEVIPYSSLGDLEDKRIVARVPLRSFRKDLLEVDLALARSLAWLPQNRLRVEITNALLCYQDGAFWWGRVDEPRVVSVSDLAGSEVQFAADRSLHISASYTVVINWRQAAEHLRRAESFLNVDRALASTGEDERSSAN